MMELTIRRHRTPQLDSSYYGIGGNTESQSVAEALQASFASIFSELKSLQKVSSG